MHSALLCFTNSELYFTLCCTLIGGPCRRVLFNCIERLRELLQLWQRPSRLSSCWTSRSSGHLTGTLMTLMVNTQPMARMSSCSSCLKHLAGSVQASPCMHRCCQPLQHSWLSVTRACWSRAALTCTSYVYRLWMCISLCVFCMQGAVRPVDLDHSKVAIAGALHVHLPAAPKRLLPHAMCAPVIITHVHLQHAAPACTKVLPQCWFAPPDSVAFVGCRNMSGSPLQSVPASWPSCNR